MKKRLFNALLFSALFCGTALMAQNTPVADGKKDQTDIQRTRYLLLDSRIIESTDNLELSVGTVKKDINNPLFGEDKPWEPRFDNPYLSIIYDEE